MTRRKVTPTEIDLIMARQNRRCADWECRTRLIAGHYQIDHVQPLSRGGKNDVTNMQALCKPCHKRKTHHPRGPHITIGGDNYEAKKQDRMRAKHGGTYIRTSPPMPGSRGSGWKQPFKGKAERRT